MDNGHNTDKDTNREKDTTGIQADRDRNTKGQGHRWTGTQTDRGWYTDGQGHRRTGRGAGTQADRKSERDTDRQAEGQEHRRTGRGTGTKADRDRN